jgi:hypothetical protein
MRELTDCQIAFEVYQLNPSHEIAAAKQCESLYGSVLEFARRTLKRTPTILSTIPDEILIQHSG